VPSEKADPHLVDWLDGWEPPAGSGHKALVVGCGPGHDAEFLVGQGFTVTAFDIAPAAIDAAKRAIPGTKVTYAVADLLDLPAAWAGAFDLVVEAYTVQSLYGQHRARALDALHLPVAAGGTLLVIASASNEMNPVRDPAQPPWALTRREINQAGGPLRSHRIEQYHDNEDPPKLRWRAEFRHD
jgi:SAM-dependent methyltransferase